MLVLRNLYTTKILPHSNATESIGKYKRKTSLATSQMRDWRVENYRSFERSGRERGLLKSEPNALSNFPQQQDHGHLPRTEPRPQVAVRNRQEGQEGVSAFKSAEDPKLAG